MSYSQSKSILSHNKFQIPSFSEIIYKECFENKERKRNDVVIEQIDMLYSN